MTAEHSKEGCQPLLPIHNQPRRHVVLLCRRADGLRATHDSVLPEEQITDWKTLVHRVKKVSNLGVRPHERPLDVRQSNVADVDVVQEAREVVVDALEAGLEFAHMVCPTIRSASFIRGSPEMSLGSNVSRRAVRVRDSLSLAA